MFYDRFILTVEHQIKEEERWKDFKEPYGFTYNHVLQGVLG